MKWFCKHQWKTVTDIVTESPFEVALRVTNDRVNVTIPHQMCSTKRKHILVVACEKCGKINQYVTDLK
jgi:hypothetical protein